MRRYRRNKRVDEIEAKYPGKKNTRRWCKGKTGVEHKVVWKNKGGNTASFLDGWYELICKACGKKLDYCFTWPWARRDQKCKCGHHAK